MMVVLIDTRRPGGERQLLDPSSRFLMSAVEIFGALDVNRAPHRSKQPLTQ